MTKPSRQCLAGCRQFHFANAHLPTPPPTATNSCAIYFRPTCPNAQYPRLALLGASKDKEAFGVFHSLALHGVLAVAGGDVARANGSNLTIAKLKKRHPRFVGLLERSTLSTKGWRHVAKKWGSVAGGGQIVGEAHTKLPKDSSGKTPLFTQKKDNHPKKRRWQGKTSCPVTLTPRSPTSARRES